jgi:hypothetical protein
MERGQVIVIAVVVAALALFGLRLWSDTTAESELQSASHGAAERLARAGGMRGDVDGRGEDLSASGEGPRAGRAGGRLGPLGPGGGGAAGSRGEGAGRGATDVVRGGTRAGGGIVGHSGSASAGGLGGGGAGGFGGSDGDRLAPKVEKRSDLVEFLGSQPPTKSDLASPQHEGDGDVALKIDKPADINEQGGEAHNVENADDGDGIKITNGTAIDFPNNVNPEAATFSFNIEPNWSGSDQTDNALLQLRGPNEWSNRIELVKNGEFLRFILTDSTGREADISTRITDWQAGQAHDVQASYGPKPDGTCCQTQLMVDGRVVGTNDYTGPFKPPPTLKVGGDHAGSAYSPADATFRQFRVMNNASFGG